MSEQAYSNNERFKKAEKVTWLGILGNILLTIFKYFAGIVGRSQAMIADATESLSDIVSTTAVLISFRVSKKPVDEDHPYGHGKAESLATAVVGLIIIASGLYIFVTSAQLLFSGDVVKPGLIALIAAVVTIIMKEAMYRYVSSSAKKLDSSAIMANAWDYRKDAISSVATLFGIVGARLGFPLLDPLVALLVSLIIFKIGYDVLVSGSNELMDKALEQSLIDQIVSFAEECKGVEHAFVRARRVGQLIYVDIKIDIDPQLTISTGHAIAKDVKIHIMKNVDNVSDVLVHVNPHYD